MCGTDENTSEPATPLLLGLPAGLRIKFTRLLYLQALLHLAPAPFRISSYTFSLPVLLAEGTAQSFLL